MQDLFQDIEKNVDFLLVFLAIITVMLAVAKFGEWWIERRHKNPEKTRQNIDGAPRDALHKTSIGQISRNALRQNISVRKITMIALFSAIAVILMLFGFPLPFVPFFYELEFSDLPILIGAFAYGPMAAVTMEFCKVILNLLINGTSTAFVGEFANFICGCAFVLPASLLYQWKRTKTGAIRSLILSTCFASATASLLNAFYLIPAFSVLYGMPLDALIGIGTKLNPAIVNLQTFVLFAVLPHNLIKFTLVSLVTLLIYKPLRPLMSPKTSL
ncbi:MAG: ECF transporter S component [Clostridium sp.]|nr:ECF transporter S component [Clostridium sp.]